MHVVRIFDMGQDYWQISTMDYPLSGDVYRLMDNVQSKTICSEFDEQLDISEALYKTNLKFNFTKKDVTELLKMQRHIRKKSEIG